MSAWMDLGAWVDLDLPPMDKSDVVYTDPEDMPPECGHERCAWDDDHLGSCIASRMRTGAPAHGGPVKRVRRP